jgi:penicillin-binding protein 1A
MSPGQRFCSLRAAGGPLELTAIHRRLALGEPMARAVFQSAFQAGFWRAFASRRRFPGIRISLPLAVVAIGAVMVWALHDISIASALVSSAEPIILLEDADGQEMSHSGPLQGVPSARQGMPQHLIDAVIAIEDQRFYTHRGIDPRGILRAFMRNMRAGEVREGGSTITQQLARTLIREDERTFRRKIRETFLALILESYLSKDEILTRYLNNIYLGAGATGISAAARIYFDKPVSELSLEESVLIAGLIRAPSQLNPLRDLAAARKRGAVVLDAMVKSGKLDERTAEAAKNHPARPVPAQRPTSSGSWFADWIHEKASSAARSLDASKHGAIRVRTTLQPKFQALAEKVVSAALKDRGKGNGVKQVALIAMRPDGAVIAMVGGRNYRESQFNHAVQARRQPGSTFKLFVYFAALRNGRSLEETIDDAPLEINGWRPKNFDHRYHGRVSLAEAFARSLNAATVRLAQEVGINEVIAAAQALGIDAPLAATPSLALGSSEVSLLDLTGAYASVGAGVAPVEPWGIARFESLDRRLSFRSGPHIRPRESLEPYRESLVELLSASVEYGTGRAAALEGFAAGKTGTTENHRDAWFVGFTEDVVAGVWVGNDNNEPMNEVTGGTLPALIWRDFMAGALKLQIRETPTAEAQQPAARTFEVAGISCDYAACSRAYRSFRASDCMYQPHFGRGKLCERESGTDDLIIGGFETENNRDAAERVASAEALISNAFDQDAYEEGLSEPAFSCNYDACSRAYRSFRASNCSYQPYQGRLKLCVLDDIADGVSGDDFDEASVGDEDINFGEEDDFEISESGLSCNYEACSRAYSSFRDSDCSYQPYRGRRRACEK